MRSLFIASYDKEEFIVKIKGYSTLIKFINAPIKLPDCVCKILKDGTRIVGKLNNTKTGLRYQFY
jgi:hypothetical protein